MRFTNIEHKNFQAKVNEFTSQNTGACTKFVQASNIRKEIGKKKAWTILKFNDRPSLLLSYSGCPSR